MASKRGWRAKIPMIQVIGRKRNKIVQKPIPQKGLSVVGKHKAGDSWLVAGQAVGVVGFLSISFTVDR